VQHRSACPLSVIDLPELLGGGAPVPGGRPSADPGGGRASGANLCQAARLVGGYHRGIRVVWAASRT
jgi:hypothetical protein